MVKGLLIGFALTATLTGCQNRQYALMCDTQVSRSFCSVGDLEAPRCRRADAAVDGCASYVSYKVREYEAAKRKETGMMIRRYSASAQSAQPILLGVVGTSTQYPVFVKGEGLVSYESSARVANDFVALRINIYRTTVQRYLNDLKKQFSADDREVLAAISDIGSLRKPLAHAVEMGLPLVGFYQAQPTSNFETLAERVVAETNPKDPYLRVGALRAIQINRRLDKNSALNRAQVALAQFKALQAEVDVPYNGEFLILQRQALAEAAAARRLAEKQRPRSRSSINEDAPSSRRQEVIESDCSCSGHNVCYGPRGGRYCITSGGNKRYGI